MSRRPDARAELDQELAGLDALEAKAIVERVGLAKVTQWLWPLVAGLSVFAVCAVAVVAPRLPRLMAVPEPGIRLVMANVWDGNPTPEAVHGLMDEKPAPKPTHRPAPGNIFRPNIAVGGKTDGQSAYLAEIDRNDIVFSIDSVITAVGMSDHLPVMIAAVVTAVIVMMFAAGPIRDFVGKHPTVKMLALSFLLLIGVMLVADAFDQHIPKGYVYFAMGFAIIPIIFSISEEALSNVPKHLIAGSLALGATRWQTLARLVLVSASPGIFSALMIGFGRAVGETMIVLMATGNTPVGRWRVYRKVPGWSWVLWYPMYFLRGFAIHGYPSVPAYPASHGCVRVPMWIAPRLYATNPFGHTVFVY